MHAIIIQPMLFPYIIIYLYTITVNNHNKTVHNLVGVHRNKPVTQMISMENNRVHIIHQRTMTNMKHTVRHIEKIDLIPLFIHITNM